MARQYLRLEADMADDLHRTDAMSLCLVIAAADALHRADATLIA